MRELIINSNDANQRLDKFLCKKFKTMPKSLMYKYIRNKNIKVNNKKCDISYKLQEGDIMKFYISDEFFEIDINLDFLNASSNLNIIYEDNNILIVFKPKGLILHSDDKISNDTLVDRVLKYLYNSNFYNPINENSFRPASVHRLDRNTEGLVIFAKTSTALRLLNESIKNNELDKYYMCSVSGTISNNAILKQYHYKDEINNKAIISNTYEDNYKEVILEYNVIDCKDNKSLLDIKLITGRSHQIRAQLASINHPIIGDSKYGSRIKSNYQELCAYKIVFNLNNELDYLNSINISVNDNSVYKNFYK